MTTSDTSQWRSEVRGIAAFVLIGCACAGLIAAAWSLTREPIAHNRALEEARAIVALTGSDGIPAAGTWHDDIWSSCHGPTLVRGAAAGYGGPIEWMLAARPSSTIAGQLAVVRVIVLRHRETPGIADFLNNPQAAWLASFIGYEAQPETIDAVSGATITSQALLRSVTAGLGRAAMLNAECERP